MTSTSTATRTAVRAHATGELSDALPQLTAQLDAGLAGRTASVLLYFASARYDSAALSGQLSSHFPDTELIGCSTAGEFTDEISSTLGISAIALPDNLITRAAAAVGALDRGVKAGVQSMVDALESALGQPLRDLDAGRYVGFVLIDGVHGQEEEVNEELGNAAPLLDIVGGSAGDDLAFTSTWVAARGEVSRHGVALVICEVAVPFQVVKTCSFAPSGRRLNMTKADVPQRIVNEFDGRPAAETYAEALGLTRDQFVADVWMVHPLGLMIDGQPWIRSPQAVLPDGSIRFYAQILEGMQVDVMDATDLIGETAAAVTRAREALGGTASASVMFNCILRRLELDAQGLGEAFTASLGDTPTAGFHTYGESWLGHVNQTLTGVMFG